MTRFARATGSKSSNKKVPDDGTPWTVLKQQLELNKLKDVNSDENEDHTDWKAVINLEKKVEENKNSVWCDFGNCITGNSSKERKKRKKEIDPEVQEEFIENRNRLSTTGEETELFKGDAPREKRKRKEFNNVHSKERKIRKERIYHEDEFSEKEKRLSLIKEENELCKGDAPRENKKGKDLNNLNSKGRKKSIDPKVQDEFMEKKLCKSEVSRGGKKRKEFNNKQKKEFIKFKKSEERVNINGQDVTIVYLDGFPIKKEDAERIDDLKKGLISKGIGKQEIFHIIRKERRNAEKSLARMKKKVCFHCREGGHNLSSCPMLSENGLPTVGSGICYKCGSTEHSHLTCRVSSGASYKFAVCFICKEEGHISKQCPDNPRGLYPKGGGCKVCGDVTHFRKNCPQIEGSTQVKLGTIQSQQLETLDETEVKSSKTQPRPRNKIIKFN